MRKWLGIGTLLLSVAVVGVGAYWLFTRTNAWTVTRVEPVAEVRVASSGDDDNDAAEPSEVIEPLIVQRPQETPMPDEMDDLAIRTDLPVCRVVLQPGMEQPPRPDLEPNEVARMPYADEEPAVGGGWFFLDWSAFKAQLRKLKILSAIEPTDPAKEAENRDTNPPAEPPQAEPVPDYHQQYPHCPYQGPCPTPYRSMPRD